MNLQKKTVSRKIKNFTIDFGRYLNSRAPYLKACVRAAQFLFVGSILFIFFLRLNEIGISDNLIDTIVIVQFTSLGLYIIGSCKRFGYITIPALISFNLYNQLYLIFEIELVWKFIFNHHYFQWIVAGLLVLIITPITLLKKNIQKIYMGVVLGIVLLELCLIIFT